MARTLLEYFKKAKPETGDIVEGSGEETRDNATPTEVTNTELYELESEPQLLVETKNEFMKNEDNYFRGCKWSPDGTCILTCNNDNILRLYNLPDELYSSPFPDDILPEMVPVVSAREGEIIYDYAWFPRMSSHDYATCCFASSSKNSPVHLLDAYDGRLRCSYLSYNHLDELISPHSLCFSLDGSKLYTGYQNMIKVFDTSIPGRDSKTITMSDDENSQCGIVSCIAMNPSCATDFVIGTYSGSVSFYSEIAKGSLFSISSYKKGISQIMFSPCGNYLFFSERKSFTLGIVDIRKYTVTLDDITRTVNTNQRIYFDISKDGDCLATGSTNGFVKFIRLNDFKFREFNAHSDAVNGCSIHPSLPLLATSSGQWKPQVIDDDDDDDDDKIIFENSLKIWSMDKIINISKTNYF
ncbi:PREDICTED: telomerase Cajal body protein 1-like [Amphimedon queenslandica]|uniref:WD repeat-containing protein 79 n=1 Tax=Amphimedon queenslandica TaxID=400682 RepID=A0A1X7VPJ4_AMPQE|nr:PREDICTED: telomerase Cajal body protein 1-like [Amphimedon queenslandica]|eukprot:XP_019863266.1 PREDICTED: telomerase Cajal body protein 1-like [Amphimedon queenslandica]